MKQKWVCLLVIASILALGSGPLLADEFNLDSLYNKGVLRFELDNDVFFDRDNNFSNGWSLQHHTRRYPAWDETSTPGFSEVIPLPQPQGRTSPAFCIRTSSGGIRLLTTSVPGLNSI